MRENTPPAGPEPELASHVLGRLEVLLEVTGAAFAFMALPPLFSAVPGANRPLILLAPGFGPVSTPAHLLALLVGLWLVPLALRRLLAGWRAIHLAGALPARPWRQIGYGLLLAAVLNLWARMLLWLEPTLFDAAWQALGTTSMEDAVRAALFVAPLTAGLAEEIFFRGYVQGALSSRYGAGWGIVLTTAGFAALHAYQGWAAVVFGVVPASLALGLLFRATGSLLAPVVAHATLDAVSFVQLGTMQHLPEQGPVVVGLLASVSLLLVALGRRSLARGLRLALDLGWSVIRDSRFLLPTAIGVTAGVSVPMTVLAVLLAATGTDASGAWPGAFLGTATVCWSLALVVHRLRHLDAGADAPRLDGGEPGRAAGEP